MKAWQINRFGIEALELVEHPVSPPGPVKCAPAAFRHPAQAAHFGKILIPTAGN